MALHESDAATQRMVGTETALQDWLRALEATTSIESKPGRLLGDVIAEQAAIHGDAPALLSAHETFTYRRLSERANRYARWALRQNLVPGETVCLLMPNRPDYIAVWLGITAVGGVVSLLNTQLRGTALAHCIDLVAPKHVIVGAELLDELPSAVAYLKCHPKIWSHGRGEFLRIDQAIEQLSGAPLTAAERPDVTTAERALNIYTSGTTGLPKAANISHHRLLLWSYWFAGLMNTAPTDRMYDCLPMYHSIGGVVAVGSLLVRGGSVFIRDKFSASEFWSDIHDWDCTLFQYIGELCRYLLNAPEHTLEVAHRLRLCCGNGLRADVWQKFQDRFHIPRILEFYASTEGNVSLYNVEGKVGAIGRVPAFLSHRSPLVLVKFDAATGQPARDADGFCTRCSVDEIGEALGRMPSGGKDGGVEFEGYTAREDSERKIVRNVFEQGDAWYRTGDLMRRDTNGFFYFVDRIGDTFRWKGENVSTSEVADAIMSFPGVTEATVYGVAVAGTEGAAGMAALVGDSAIDLAALRRHLSRRLPSYARPLFLRIQASIAVTATFKHTKLDLMREGFDPASTTDAIYFDDPSQHAYIRVDAALHARIVSGEQRL